jgi:hypothetical protein
MALYTDLSSLRAELRATADFSASTYPTAEQALAWIEEESDYIKTLSGRNWGSDSYEEVLDYNGEDTILLREAPILSVTSMVYATAPLGTDTYSLSASMVEDTDFTVYKETGEISILGNIPYPGRKAVKVSYTAGFEDVPSRIKMLATKRAARRIIDSLLTKDLNEKQSGKSVSVGSISIVKPADFGVNQYASLKETIAELEEKIVNGTTAYRLPTHRF